MMQIIKLLKKYAFFFILFFMSGQCLAITVSTVYRADIRTPDRVFSEGFRAWGTNTNYISHVLGLSGVSGSRNSAFIPTTSNYDIAAEFARERAIATGQEYYIYNVRATDNMYPALESVYNIYDSHNVRVSEDVRGTVSREQEYSAYSFISPQQIRSVEVLRFGDGHWTSETRSNPNYQDSPTRSHDGPYTNSNSHPLNHTARLLIGFSGIGAEFLPEDDYENHHPPVSCWNCFSHSEF